MIVFDLRCDPQGHVFEAWFGSTEDYVAQRERGLVQCPLCGSEDVGKAVMAPRVASKGSGAGPAEDSPNPEDAKAMLAALASLQEKLLRRSDYVGRRFADEARAIHLGEAEARSIHGSATSAEAASLIEEGIPVCPLPLPVIEPGQEN